MSNNNSSSEGIGFFGLLPIVFITLKLCHVIEWRWFWVLCPLWGPAAICVVVFAIGFLGQFLKDKEVKRRDNSSHGEQACKNTGRSKWQERMEQMQEIHRKQKEQF